MRHVSFQTVGVVVSAALLACIPNLPPESRPGARSSADAATELDGGNTGEPDAGQVADAGQVTTDAGQIADAGPVTTDAGQPDAGPTADGGSPDAGPYVDAGSPIGGPCSGSSDCQSGDCLPSYIDPGGYCTQDCSNSTCPAGTTCTNELGFAHECLQNCTSQAQCRQGYVCQPTEGVCDLPCATSFQCGSNQCDTSTGECLKSCQLGTDCPAGQVCQANVCEPPPAPCGSAGPCPAGETCDPSTQTCGGQVGDICTQDTDCVAGSGPTCLTAAEGFPGGYCTASCTAYGGENGCPSGYHCVQGIAPGGSNQLLCASECSTAADCRTSYQCAPVTNGSVCIPSS